MTTNSNIQTQMNGLDGNVEKLTGVVNVRDVDGVDGEIQVPSSPASTTSSMFNKHTSMASSEAPSASFPLSPSGSAFSLEQLSASSPTFPYDDSDLDKDGMSDSQPLTPQDSTPVHANLSGEDSRFGDVKGLRRSSRSSSLSSSGSASGSFKDHRQVGQEYDDDDDDDSRLHVVEDSRIGVALSNSMETLNDGEDQIEKLRKENARLKKLVEEAYEEEGTEGKSLLPHFLTLQSKYSKLQEAHADMSHSLHALTAEVEMLRPLKAEFEETKKELEDSKETVSFLRKGLEEARKTATKMNRHSRQGSFASVDEVGRVNKRFSIASSLAGFTSSSSGLEDDTAPTTPTSLNRRSIQITPKVGSRRQFSLSLSLNSENSNVNDQEVLTPGGSLIPLRLSPLNPNPSTRDIDPSRRLSSSTLASLSENEEGFTLDRGRTPSPIPSPGLQVPNGAASPTLRLKEEHEKEVMMLRDRINSLSRQLLEAEEGRQASENLLKVLREFMAGNKEAAKRWAEHNGGSGTGNLGEGELHDVGEVVRLPPLPTEADPDLEESKPQISTSASKWALPRFGSFGSRAAYPFKTTTTTSPELASTSTSLSVKEDPTSPPESVTGSMETPASSPPPSATIAASSIFSAGFGWGRKASVTANNKEEGVVGRESVDLEATPVKEKAPRSSIDSTGSPSATPRRKFPSFSFGTVFGKGVQQEKGLPPPPESEEEDLKEDKENVDLNGDGKQPLTPNTPVTPKPEMTKPIPEPLSERAISGDGDLGHSKLDEEDVKTPVVAEMKTEVGEAK